MYKDGLGRVFGHYGIKQSTLYKRDEKRIAEVKRTFRSTW